MMEIYNEKIQDLFIPVNRRPQGGYKLRENKELGVYVEDLLRKEVKSYKDIEEVMDLGNKHRTIASTLMNQTSSRAHTIVTFHLI